MAFDGDPYRTLGLVRGASLDDVKRAYRRLAKANHPDAAGSGALPRFLAIQAAYEQLVGGPGVPGGPAGAGAAPRASSNAARRASEGDPDRADATRRAYGGRAKGRGTAGETPGRRRASGGTPGAAGSGPASGARPAGAEPAGRSGSEQGRRRGKATLGSTSYDEVDAGAAEPDWSGASWYGTTSGTYWTINPKEYADPRKHGPEYQARARRASGGRSEHDPNGPGDTGAPTHTTRSWWSSTSGQGAPDDDRFAPDPPRQPVGERAAPIDDPVPDPARALIGLARALTDDRAGGLRGRIGRAFLGWVPIALGLGWLLGELTGCGRFAATCDPAVNPLILAGQGAVLIALLLLPSAASLAAVAALTLLAAAVAATLVLSATGTAADEVSRRTTLAVLLLAAWLAGLAIAIVQRLRSVSAGVGPVS